MPLEGASVEFDEPFTVFAAHHFSVPEELARPKRTGIFARTTADSLSGFTVVVLQWQPPKEIGRDAAGNPMLQEQPPIPVSAHVCWKVFGE